MTDRGVNAFHLIGGDRRADAGPADQNSALGFSALDFFADLFRKIREVYSIRAEGAYIDHFVTKRLDRCDDNILERKAPVVTTDCYFHFFLIHK